MHDNNQSSFNPYAQNVAIIKNYFRRPTVLVLGILYVVSIVLSVIVTLTSGGSLSEMYRAVFEFQGSGITAEDMQIFNAITTPQTMTIIMMVAMIPSLIISTLSAIAHFVIYYKSKNDDASSNPKAGFTVLYVLTILNLISVAFAVLMLLIFIVAFIVLIVSAFQDPTIASNELVIITALCSFMVILFAGVGALMLIYAISNLNYIKSVRKGLTSVNLSYKGAGVYGVFSMIYGVITLLSAIQSLLYAPMTQMINQMAPEEFPTEMFEGLSSITLVSALGSAVSGAAMIVTAVIALGYKKYIKNITDGFSGFGVTPTSAPYSPQQPEPQFATPVVTNTVPPAVQPAVCPRCGTPAKDEDIFCNSCGTKIR